MSKDFTKQFNEIIFQNILYIHDYMKSHKIPSELWIRTPIIPDTTTTPYCEDLIKNEKVKSAYLGGRE